MRSALHLWSKLILKASFPLCPSDSSSSEHSPVFYFCSISGNILDGDANGFGINRPDWMLHSAVYEALPTVRCVIQLSTPAAIAVSIYGSLVWCTTPLTCVMVSLV